MKRLLALLAFLWAFPASAQTCTQTYSQSVVLGNINTSIVTNGTGAITAAVLNPILQQILCAFPPFPTATTLGGVYTSTAPTGYYVSGIGTNGGLTFSPFTSTFGPQTANTFFASPTVSGGIPSFRAIVPLDLPPISLSGIGVNGGVTGTLPSTNVAAINLAGTGNGGVTGTLPSASVTPINMASNGNGGVTGVLGTTNGGTGVNAFNAVNSVITTYTIATSDNNKIVSMGGSAFYTLTFPAASGFPAPFCVSIYDADAGRGKTVVLTGGQTYILWPGQQDKICSNGSVWIPSHPATRWKVPATTSFYVDLVNGTSTADGLAASGSGAFDNFTDAYNSIAANVDFNNQNVSINFIAGQTDTIGSATSPDVNIVKAWTGGGQLIIDCHGATLGPTAQFAAAFQVGLAGYPTLQNCTFGGTVAYDVDVSAPVTVVLAGAMTYGVASGGHIFVSGPGSVLTITGTETITGAAPVHLIATQTGMLADCMTSTTASGSIAFSSAYASAAYLGQIVAKACGAADTFTGTFTGSRYLVAQIGIITNTGSTTYYPGNAAGTVSANSVYN